jgi:hypothetical protein
VLDLSPLETPTETPMRFTSGLIVAAALTFAASASAADLLVSQRTVSIERLVVASYGGPIYSDYRPVGGLGRFADVRHCPVTRVRHPVGAVTVIYDCPRAW